MLTTIGDDDNASETDATKTPPLLRMPAELRNSIYDFVFASDDEHAVDGGEPGITRACRRTRRESLLFFYSSVKLRATVKPTQVEVSKPTKKKTKSKKTKTVLVTKNSYVEPLVAWLEQKPTEVISAIRVLEITWVMAGLEERHPLERSLHRCTLQQGTQSRVHWGKLRAALQEADLLGRLKWKRCGNWVLYVPEREKKLEWRQKETIEASDGFTRMMNKFMQEDTIGHHVAMIRLVRWEGDVAVYEPVVSYR